MSRTRGVSPAPQRKSKKRWPITWISRSSVWNKVHEPDMRGLAGGPGKYQKEAESSIYSASLFFPVNLKVNADEEEFDMVTNYEMGKAQLRPEHARIYNLFLRDKEDAMIVDMVCEADTEENAKSEISGPVSVGSTVPPMEDHMAAFLEPENDNDIY